MKTFCTFLFAQLILLSSLAYSGPLGYSDKARAEQWRDEARALVAASIEKGRSCFGSVNLKHVFMDLMTPRFENEDRFRMRGRSGNRRSAMYDPYFKRVAFSFEELEGYSAEKRAPLVLHELLGAAGYDDREYGLTLRILYSGVRSTPQTLVTNQFLASEICEEIRLAGLGGSVTSVGGGGDFDELDVKLFVLNVLNSREASGQKSFKDLSNLQIARFVFNARFYISTRPEVVVVNSTYAGTPDLKQNATLGVHRDWFRDEAYSRESKAGFLLEGSAMAVKVQHGYDKAVSSSANTFDSAQ